MIGLTKHAISNAGFSGALTRPRWKEGAMTLTVVLVPAVMALAAVGGWKTVSARTFMGGLGLTVAASMAAMLAGGEVAKELGISQLAAVGILLGSAVVAFFAGILANAARMYLRAYALKVLLLLLLVAVGAYFLL